MDTEGEVFSRLGSLSLEKLEQLKEHVEIGTVIPDGKKNKSFLLRMIIKYLSSDEILNLEDEGLSTFLSTLDFIKKGENVDEVKIEPDVEKKPDSKSKTEENLEKTELISKELISKWKKDLKISGSIGLPGQKDKITFSSLAYQIENALKKGYKDSEICEAVVRSISPDLQLRGFLEGKSDLTLQNLHRILRSFAGKRSYNLV